ncbi:N-acetylmuramoyl-L-alanine amidase [Bacillus sp. 1P06AnD]|uniref:N-acetylmuramoyl-L-alanine amidase n=1 Tax=Bacillus sp. 1P06AnD TaxID=3132208 RepID=UPI0039A018AF
MKKGVKLTACFLLAATTVFSAHIGQSKAATKTFKDIGPNSQHMKEITYLAEGGIVQGDKYGNFNPNNKITRAEFTIMLGRALDLEGTPRDTKFKDVTKLGTTGSGYIQAATDKGFIAGYKGGNFKPGKTITRGEMATIISRAFNYSFDNTTSGAARALLDRGIDQRQSDNSFAAGRPGTRDEMAIFLARAIDYTLRTPAETTFTGTKYVNVDANDPLNVRKGPSTEYAPIASLNKGETVSIAYTVGNWSMIKSSNSVIGFVLSKYLGSSANANTPSNGKSVKDLLLIIDAGHGMQDSGTIGNGAKEKDIVLSIVLKMKQMLDQTDFGTKYVRTTDNEFMSIYERARWANAQGADLYVSVHANSVDNNTSANGTETYYYKPSNPDQRMYESQKLASYIQKRVVNALETRDRHVKDNSYIVIKNTDMPAALVETGFLSNKEDAAKLKSEVYQKKAAEAIFYGIMDYYKAKGYDVDSYYGIH